MKIRRLTALLLAIGAVTLFAPLAGAQPTPTPTCIPGSPPPAATEVPPIAPPYARPKGLRITVTGVNPATREVSFNVTLNTTAGFASTTRLYPHGSVNDTWQTIYGGTTNGNIPSWFQPYCSTVGIPVQTYNAGGFVGPMVVDPAWPSLQDGAFGLWVNAYLDQGGTASWAPFYGGGIPWPAFIDNPTIQPVEFGDGQFVPGPPILPLVNPGPQYGTFRGSFTHTYPASPDTFTIRAAAASLFLGENSASNPYLTGLTTGRPGIVVGNGQTFRVARFSWGSPGGTTTTTTSWSGSPTSWGAYAILTSTVTSQLGRVLAITNTALVDFNAAAIPTASAAGLFGLALLLAGIGIIIMRR